MPAAAAELYAHPLVCMNYAACLMKQRKYGSALHYLNVAWKQDNRNAMIATNMARCHYEMGDDRNCEAFVNKALALAPDYGLAFLWQNFLQPKMLNVDRFLSDTQKTRTTDWLLPVSPSRRKPLA